MSEVKSNPMNTILLRESLFWYICIHFSIYIFVISPLCRNANPTLPYEDNSFDVVTCVVSIDYLTKPIEVLKEVNACDSLHVMCLSYLSTIANSSSFIE